MTKNQTTDPSAKEKAGSRLAESSGSDFFAEDENTHECPRCHGIGGDPMDDPLHTVTGTDHNSLVCASMIRHFGKSVGSELDNPMGTVTAGGGGKSGLVVSHLSKMYGTATGQSLSEPLHTITGGGNHIAEVRAFLIKYYGDGGQLASCRDPMHTITSKERVGLVMVQVQEHAIVDIGMRMLEPHELYIAQGFPRDYIINLRHNGKFLSKKAQVRMVGNSVCPPLSAAIVSANYADKQEN